MIKKFKSLKNRNGIIKYFNNTIWLLSERILRLVVGLFVGVWVARYLGPEKFGIISYAQSFVGLFAAFSTLGLDSIVVRELVKDESRRDELIGTAFCLKLLGSILSFGFLAIAIQLTSSDKFTKIIVLVIALTPLFQSFNVIDFYFQSKVLSRYVVLANTITLLLSSLFKIILILMRAQLVFFAWVVLFESFILACGLIFYFKKNVLFSFKNFNFKKSTALTLLKDSWPLMLSSVFVSIYMRIDQVMIMEMIGAEANGQYAAAVRISEAWYFIPVVINSSLFPAIINAQKKSKELYNKRLQNMYDLMVWMAIAIAIPMTFLSDWLILMLYGSHYTQAASILMIHIWASIFVFLGTAGAFYTIENITKIIFIKTIIGAILNIILNYIFIPIFGIKYVAIATLLSQMVANYLFDFILPSTRKQFYLKTKSFFPIHLINYSNRFKY